MIRFILFLVCLAVLVLDTQPHGVTYDDDHISAETTAKTLAIAQ